MRKHLLIILFSFALFNGCATVKNFFSKKSIIDPDDPNFLNNIQKLRSAYQDGDIQALEENSTNHLPANMSSQMMRSIWG